MTALRQNRRSILLKTGGLLTETGWGPGGGVDRHSGRPTLWIKLPLGYDMLLATGSLLLFDVVLNAE
jgi:hypothetical protein